MKSAMQELIDKFTELAKKEGDGGFVGRSVIAIINNNNFLEKEKQIIIEAYSEGNASDFNGHLNGSEQYYNETFKNSQQ